MSTITTYSTDNLSAPVTLATWRVSVYKPGKAYTFKVPETQPVIYKRQDISAAAWNAEGLKGGDNTTGGDYAGWLLRAQKYIKASSNPTPPIREWSLGTACYMKQYAQASFTYNGPTGTYLEIDGISSLAFSYFTSRLGLNVYFVYSIGKSSTWVNSQPVALFHKKFIDVRPSCNFP